MESRIERKCGLQTELPGCAPIIEIVPVDHIEGKCTNITNGEKDPRNYCSC